MTMANKWRESASLLLLAKQNIPKCNKFDYKALLFTRTSKSSFMPNSSVFPGGATESVDADFNWLQHFKEFGYTSDQFKKLVAINAPRPTIFSRSINDNLLENAISLRITAIRETFEEVGVLLCRDRRSFANATGYAYFKEDFERQHWRQLVHNDASKFLELCKALDVVPDLWSLHEWSAWLTPSTFKRRFMTGFYLVALPQIPNVIIEPKEVTTYAWRTPLAYLKAALNKELWLPPPQFYELSRLLHFTELEELRKFAAERQSKGIVLTHPVVYKCNDGEVHLLPGDDLYPNDPDASSIFIDTGISVKQFRESAKRLHRSEHFSQHVMNLYQNFDCIDGHLPPLDPGKFNV